MKSSEPDTISSLPLPCMRACTGGAKVMHSQPLISPIPNSVLLLPTVYLMPAPQLQLVTAAIVSRWKFTLSSPIVYLLA